MTTLAVVLALAAMIISLVNLAANVEIFSSIDSIRSDRQMNDDLRDLRLPADRTIDLHALTQHAGSPETDLKSFLFLSTKCQSCHALAYDLKGEPPPHLHIFLAAGSTEEVEAWKEKYDLRDECTGDLMGALASACGIDTFPSLIHFNPDGKTRTGYAISSFRTLQTALSTHH